MSYRFIMLQCLFLLCLCWSFSLGVAATPLENALGHLGTVDNRNTLIEIIETLGKSGDAKALPVLQALRDNRLHTTESGRLLTVDDKGHMQEVLTGVSVSADNVELRKLPTINNAVRRVLLPAIAKLQLNDSNPSVRLQAAEELRKYPPEGASELLKQAIALEQDKKVGQVLKSALAQIKLDSPQREERLEAIRLLGEIGNIEFKSALINLLNKNPDGSYFEKDNEIRQAAQVALNKINRTQQFIAQVGNIFYGLSLGSVLLLAALGLAITFGLMGVINMAHGEMLMLGAYTTYVVQNLFKSYFPAWFDAYLIIALPMAFLVSGLIGIVLERTLIRHLYGRPLETLLATWGISLILIQTIRLLFGAQNVEVANPTWLSGGWELASGLVLPYSRLAILGFVILVVLAVWLVLQRTRLGLQARAVTQNRNMAACMGIHTAHVDMWTFGLGSGVAGLGGVALSQIGNVGPELGQTYIVDSFMVVVLGGVGKIAGTVMAALGLGIVNKFLEPEVGAVLAKILVLVFIILFIQKRPQGIFALKGRVAES